MPDFYRGREQTKAKHYVLRRYLQALGFKVLTFADLAYVDGFSGPWNSRAEDFADSSFMIAINVLLDVQTKVYERTGKRRWVRCFFSEADPTAYQQLRDAVMPFHKPAEKFEVSTFEGRFEDAVSDARSFVASSFPLVFIDPTGWTGYPLEKIKALFARPRCEVLINFMYDHVNRFAYSEDADIVASLDPILGGPGWATRLDRTLPRGPAVEKLFRETLKTSCGFEYVVSTRIDKATADRPHFFIAYGTKDFNGLKVFRQVEYDALRQHHQERANARERQREERDGIGDLFSGYDAEVQSSSIDDLVNASKASAKARVIEHLGAAPIPFTRLAAGVMQAFMMRETNVKDLCVELAKEGVIERTWVGRHKPGSSDLIRRAATE